MKKNEAGIALPRYPAVLCFDSGAMPSNELFPLPFVPSEPLLCPRGF